MRPLRPRGALVGPVRAAAPAGARAGPPSAAPSRSALPTQSAPVSPPPITTTSLPAAVISRSIGGCRRSARKGWARTRSDAPPSGCAGRGTPSRSARRRARGRAPAGRAARAIRSPARPRRSRSRSSCDGHVACPTSTPQRNSTPSASSCSTRRCTSRLLHLEVGHAEAQQPADASSRSNTVTRVPGAAQLLRGGQPAGPEPTTATVLPVSRRSGGCGMTQPSSKARSMIASSICLIVTGSPLIPSTQAASHGAGHRRPVNSGKLLVACSASIASRQSVAVDEVVPLRDQVAQRAAVVAERHAAVHAASALLAQLADRPRAGTRGSRATRSHRIALGRCRARSIFRNAPACPSGTLLADRVQRRRAVGELRSPRRGRQRLLASSPSTRL